MNEKPQSRFTRFFPNYRTVWRWHFYAGLFAVPFVLLLCVTGTIYLFKPQIESWQDREFDRLQLSGTPLPPGMLVERALASAPGSQFESYELPPTPSAAARIMLNRSGRATRMLVHPATGDVLHSTPEDERLTNVVKRLHGQLLIGPWGSHLVELAACWTVILILSGLFLWWPRQSRTWGGVLYPRLRSGSKIFWRDIHSVTGVWISCLALFLIFTGLPWADLWGAYFKQIRRLTGTAVARQDWTTGGRNESAAGGHAEHRPAARSPSRNSSSGNHWRKAPVDFTPELAEQLDRVVLCAAQLDLPAPVVISAPASSGGDWSVQSLTPNRPLRRELTVSGESGAVTSLQTFRDRHWLDRIVGYGIAAHEGQLFGWANQLLGVLTTCGLSLLSVSGLVMWLKRREPGSLGAPRAVAAERPGLPFVGTVLALAVLLPMFGLSLLAVAAAERLVLRRIPGVANWLGLSP